MLDDIWSKVMQKPFKMVYQLETMYHIPQLEFDFAALNNLRISASKNIKHVMITVSLWTWAKLKSWSWTSVRDSSGPTLLLWSAGPLWRGWAASSTSVKTSLRTWLGLHTFKLRLRKPGKDFTICDSWGNSGSHQLSWKLSTQGPKKVY